MESSSPPRRIAGFDPRLLMVLGLLVLTVLATRYWSPAGNSAPNDPKAEPRPVVARGDLAADEKSTIELFRTCSSSVCFIETARLQRRSTDMNELEVPRGSGSGFVWDRQGHVVTNYHVLDGASTARVTLADRSTYDAELTGSAPDKDLAVLKINAPADDLPPLAVGTSGNLEVGQKVFAIGNPFGLDQTLTTGIISGLGREIESLTKRPIKGVIQTDAAINPGNSGGPLLDSAGLLIGVNTAIYSPSGSSAGIGFAVPVDIVNSVVPQLIKYGKIVKPGLGVQLLPDGVAAREGIEGVVLREVMDGTPAKKAGLLGMRRDEEGPWQLGDVIVAADGAPVKNSRDLYSALDDRKAGETIKLKVQREGKHIDVDVTLEELKQ